MAAAAAVAAVRAAAGVAALAPTKCLLRVSRQLAQGACRIPPAAVAAAVAAVAATARLLLPAGAVAVAVAAAAWQRCGLSRPHGAAAATPPLQQQELSKHKPRETINQETP